MSKLSDVIDMRLKELGIKGSKMCDDLGISRSTLTELRKGRATTLKADRAAAIANYLGVTVDYLLGNVSEPFLFKDEKGILHIDSVDSITSPSSAGSDCRYRGASGS